MKKTELVAKMRNQITGSDKMAVKAMLRLYEYQTADEKAVNDTVHHNNVGFNSSDARWMTWASKAVLAGRELKGYHLETLKQKIGKYANQLVNQSIEKGLIKKVKKGEYIYG